MSVPGTSAPLASNNRKAGVASSNFPFSYFNSTVGCPSITSDSMVWVVSGGLPDVSLVRARYGFAFETLINSTRLKSTVSFTFFGLKGMVPKVFKLIPLRISTVSSHNHSRRSTR